VLEGEQKMDRRRLTSVAVLILSVCGAASAAKVKNAAPREAFGTMVSAEALENYTLVELKSVYFLGKTTCSAQEKALLANEMKQWPKPAVIEIRGYADGAASPADNRTLSATRAGIVAAWLRNNGVPAERILVIGLGAVDNGPALKPEHQRVDIRVFVEPQASGTTSQ
jgi:outer membrane protein OmpA-like peptidoglycan-associated protein